MKKRFIFYILIFTIFCCSIFFVYQIYEPKQVDVQVNKINYNIDNTISIDELDEKLLDGQEVCVIFYKNNDVTSKYLFDTILTSIQSSYSLTTIDNLYYFDATNYEDVDLLKTKYSIENYPSIVKYTYKKGEAVANDLIENLSDTSITYEKIENWLLEQEIISE